VGVAKVEKRSSLLLFLERHLLSLVVVDLVGGSLLVLQVLGYQILQVGLGLRLHCQHPNMIHDKKDSRIQAHPYLLRCTNGRKPFVGTWQRIDLQYV
jgi:hypothetical protein